MRRNLINCHLSTVTFVGSFYILFKKMIVIREHKIFMTESYLEIGTKK
jgi:hypothetical protein